MLDLISDQVRLLKGRSKAERLLSLKKYSEVPQAAIRKQIADRAVSVLTKALTNEMKKKSPKFSIPEETRSSFAVTIADEFVFRALFVREPQ
jgi:hypothetical protein